jgi:caffeoyl-CoA O-methyltransferase
MTVSKPEIRVSRSTPLSPMGKRESFFNPAMQDFCVALFGPEDEHLRGISEGAQQRGFPAISISAMDGQVLRFLVTLCGARHAVEIGTLAGYSALWIARALPAGGRFDGFEIDPERAQFARDALARANPSPEVHIYQGPALENLAKVQGPVDFVFIDADKEQYPAYLSWAADHLRPGGMVALDNAFAWGGVVDPTVLGHRASDAHAVRSSLELLARDPRFVSAAMIPTNEGLAVALKR